MMKGHLSAHFKLWHLNLGHMSPVIIWNSLPCLLPKPSNEPARSQSLRVTSAASFHQVPIIPTLAGELARTQISRCNAC